MTMLGSMTRIPTAHAARHLQQLCAHWKQRFKVELGEMRGTVRIPRDARDAGWPADGLIVLIAGVVDLEVRIEASCDDQLEAIKGAVGRHLGRFAGRDMALAIEWR
jgi:hypothetical protein